LNLRFAVRNVDLKLISPSFSSTISFIIFLLSTSKSAYRSLSFLLSHQKPLCTILSLACYIRAMPVLSLLTRTFYFPRSGNSEARHCIIFSTSSCVIHFGHSSALCSQTPLVCVLSIMSETKFLICPKIRATLYFLFLFHFILNIYLIF
jgi:hypothetical protein